MVGDKTKAVQVSEMKAPKYHGHTRIELTDVNTGEVEVIEHDNLVTNFSNVLFRPLGVYNMGAQGAHVGTYGLQYPDVLYPDAMIDVFGGVMLFTDDFTGRDADDYYLEGSETMVANAAYGVTSNDEVEEMGSYNSAESGWSVDHTSFTFVYDYTTNQANGTIKSLCLTNPCHAYWGAGNKSSEIRKETGHNPMMARNYASGSGDLMGGTPKGLIDFAPELLVSAPGSASGNNQTDCLAWINVGANEIAVFHKRIPEMLAEGKITIDVYDIGLSKMLYLSPANYRKTDAHAIKRTLEFSITQYQDASASGNWWGGYCWHTKGKTYLVAGKRYNDQKCRLYTIDTALETCTESAEFTVFVGGSGSSMLSFWTLDGNELWFMGADNAMTRTSIYKVDLTEGTKTEYNTTNDDPDFVWGMQEQHVKIGDAVYCANGIYDGTDFVPTNGERWTDVQYSRTTNAGYCVGTACDTEDVLIFSNTETCTTATANANARQYVLKRNPYWISTINVLETAVTKTSAKTMKVTYTITQEDEEEEA